MCACCIVFFKSATCAIITLPISSCCLFLKETFLLQSWHFALITYTLTHLLGSHHGYHWQFPFSRFVRLTAELSLFEVTGLASNRPAPTLLSSRKAATGSGTPLLCILFETNPLDESANQRLYVESQPLEIIYDAVSDICRWHVGEHEMHDGAVVFF